MHEGRPEHSVIVGPKLAWNRCTPSSQLPAGTVSWTMKSNPSPPARDPAFVGTIPIHPSPGTQPDGMQSAAIQSFETASSRISDTSAPDPATFTERASPAGTAVRDSVTGPIAGNA